MKTWILQLSALIILFIGIIWGVDKIDYLQAQVLNNTSGKPHVSPHKEDDRANNFKNFKIESEHKDPNTGQWVQVVTYDDGPIKVTQTLILPPKPGERDPIKVDTMNLDSVIVVVEKEKYLTSIVYKRKRIRQYRAVFGPNRLVDKFYEGDGSTPEGWFKIVQIRDHKSWQKFLLLDYPNSESFNRYQERKKQGLIPSNRGIGHSVGIHGTAKGSDRMVDAGYGWTEGCIALKSSDIYDFVKFVKPGTRVIVRR